MLRFVYGDDLTLFPLLADGMFRDRAAQFRDRRGWDVRVDETGKERDEYDALNPLYVMWQNPDGSHGGSMRFLPTTGPTMINDHFLELTGGVKIESPVIWECTRFCLNAKAGPRVAACLMLAGGEIMQRFGVNHFVGIFDRPMERIYRKIGASPTILGSKGEGRERTSVGLWQFSAEAQALVACSAGVTLEQTQQWFDSSFGAKQVAKMLA